MAETLNERTLLPEHPDQLAEVRRFFDSTDAPTGMAILRSAEGQVMALPTEVFEGLRLV